MSKRKREREREREIERETEKKEREKGLLGLLGWGAARATLDTVQAKKAEQERKAQEAAALEAARAEETDEERAQRERFACTHTRALYSRSHTLVLAGKRNFRRRQLTNFSS